MRSAVLSRERLFAILRNQGVIQLGEVQRFCASCGYVPTELDRAQGACTHCRCDEWTFATLRDLAAEAEEARR